MTRAWTHFAFLLFLALPISGFAQQNLALLDKAYVHVLQKEYQAALDITQPLLDQLSLNTIEEITLAHKILGVSKCELEDYPKALDHFQTVKTFTPGESLDGVPVSSTCQQLFVKLTLPKTKKGVATRSQPSNQPTALTLVQNQDRIKNSLSAGYYVPFGVGQFKNGDKKKGVAFLIAQTLLYSTAAVTLSSYAQQDDPSLALRDVGITSLIGGGFVSIWGITEAVQSRRHNP
jgi:hypothetical protein